MFKKATAYICAQNNQNMKRISLVLVLFVSLITACNKKETGCPYTPSTLVAPQSEVTTIEQYLATNNITGTTQHPSGFHYKITAPGSGSTPTLCSQIGINYKGQLADGTVFDQTTGQIRVFVLGQLIPGWQLGIPLIKPGGGKITLYIPPTLGYGSTAIKDNQGNVVIPANSMLIFEVELVAMG